MSIDSKALVEEGTPRYLASGDPDLADYYPAWLDKLADDATVEGSVLDGAVQGAEAVRTIVATIRTMYGDSQQFHFTEAPVATTGGSRTTSLGSTTTPLAALLWLRATPPGRPSTSSRATGRSTRCSTSRVGCARSSPARPTPNTSSTGRCGTTTVEILAPQKETSPTSRAARRTQRDDNPSGTARFSNGVRTRVVGRNRRRARAPIATRSSFAHLGNRPR